MCALCHEWCASVSTLVHNYLNHSKILGATELVSYYIGAPGLTTRSKDATRGSWHRY